MNIPKIVHSSWYSPLEHLWSDPRLDQIQRELGKMKFTPEAQNIFRAFSMPMNEVRVVMTCLSPYSQVGYATGLAMATPRFETTTNKAIRDALYNDYCDIRIDELFDYTLESWHKQGVFLFNKSLTSVTDRFNPREFIEPDGSWPGWRWFTQGAIEAIDKHLNAVVFCFLGKDAMEYSKLISARNYILEAPHPAASYYWLKNNKGTVPRLIDFSRAELFTRIDEITFDLNKTKIKWY